jgi:hypothetical protein
MHLARTALACLVLAACTKPKPDARFVPVRAERDPGLLKTLSVGDTEYALLQLERYSSLYGAKDYWVTWRKKGAAVDKKDPKAGWADPLFTGAVYQLAPPELRLIPTEILEFSGDGSAFTLSIGVPTTKAAAYPDVLPLTKTFTLADLKRDADADGLTDITEALFMLPPDNPDADGDGKKDGEDRDPLAGAGAGELTDEERLMRAAYARYSCEPGEPVIFQEGPRGPFAVPTKGCVNLMLPKEKLEAFLAPGADGKPRYDRSIDAIRFASKIAGDSATVKLGNDIGAQVWIFKRKGDDWLFDRVGLNEPYDK